MVSIFVTAEVSNELTSRLVNELQLINMEFIFVTAEVSNELTSRLVNELQKINMEFIFVTADVSNELTSRLVNESQLANIEVIFVTAEVSNELTSRLVNELQLANMPYIFVTAEVSKFVRSTSVKFSHQKNQYAVETGFTTSLKDTVLIDSLFSYHGAYFLEPLFVYVSVSNPVYVFNTFPLPASGVFPRWNTNSPLS